jgi:ketosteroid isomerase-like protein
METRHLNQTPDSKPSLPGNTLKCATNALFGLALVGLTACGTPAAKAADDETKAIGDVVLEYGKALDADNVTDVMKVYAADAVVAPPGQPVKRGTAEVSKFYQDLFAAADVTLTFTIEKVSADSSLAYVMSHSVGKLKFKDGSPDFDGQGRELFVLRKQAGAWKIVAYWFNN